MLILATTCLAACGSDATTAPPGDVTPSYSIVLAGDLTGTRSGISISQYFINGWSEEANGSGTKYSSDVTLIAFASLDPTQPQTNIGLLGTAKLGTYRVRVLGSPFGTTPEFYGAYRIHNADGTSTVYDATTGTVTITAVSPSIRGTFAFHSARSSTWPAVLTGSITVASVPASLDVSGSFVAKVP
jgi:hypothetical protein